MGRPNYQYDMTTCAGGINGQADKITKEQCLEAVNFWAPDGIVVQRPGYVGIGSILFFEQAGSVAADTLIKETSAGVITVGIPLNVGSLDVGDFVYVGFATSATNLDLGFHLSIATTTQNTASTLAQFSYYSSDGTWKNLEYMGVEYDAGGGYENFGLSYFLKSSSTPQLFYFVGPKDWATTSINTITKYYLRFRLYEAAISAGTTISGATYWKIAKTPTTDGSEDTSAYVRLHKAVQLPTRKVYVSLVSSLASGVNQNSGFLYDGLPYLNLRTLDYQYNNATPFAVTNNISAPGTMAVIPDYGDLYVAYNYRIWWPDIVSLSDHGYATVPSDSGLPREATIETDTTLLAAYTGVDLLNEYPRANFIEYFRGELWAANLQENPHQIRWSAPTTALTPGYKIWPVLNTEVLTSNDNSPITAIKGYNQNMVVFTNDTIWEMIDAGISDNDLQLYAPEMRVTGKGTIAAGSVQEVNGNLIFLSEDGIYAYNGRSTVQNLGQDPTTGVDRIKHIIKRIPIGVRQNAVGVHWAAKHCYLLAIALDGAKHNNHVLVFDYENNTWWLWNGFFVDQWLLDEGALDQQLLYFVDHGNRVCLLGVSNEDHGAAITSYLVTRDMHDSKITKRARALEVSSTNLTSSLTYEIVPNTAPFGASLGSSGTIAYTDSVEKNYDTAVYDVDTYTLSRDRVRERNVLLNGKSFRVKLTHNTKNTPAEIENVAVGAVLTGKR